MNKTLIRLAGAALVLISVSAWPASTKQEVLELKEQVAEMRKDLAEIKKLLEQGARAPAAGAQAAGFAPQTVEIGDSPYKGELDAPVTIIEYSDYQCPFCARNYREVLPLIEQEYISSGKVKFVMRENPLPNLHRDAMGAAMAAQCAGDQGKYWEMHNVMFDNHRQLGTDNLKSYAADVGLDQAAFDECLDSKKHEKTVQQDMASGSKLGVSGTPAFFVGQTDSSDPNKVKLTVFIKGAQDINKFRASINDILGSAD